MKNKDKIIKSGIIIVSITGLTLCIAMLFPQVRQMIIGFAERMMHRKTSLYGDWSKTLLSYAVGGISLIILFGYCLLTASGKTLVRNVRNEIGECLTVIDWRSFIKLVLIMSGIYLLGTGSLIRANFLYNDDILRSITGDRRWYDWSRYVAEFFSVFIHADYRLTDISPLPQIIAVLILSGSSVLLVYVLNNNKITVIGLLASVPLGLSPYMLECLSFKFDAPYMALSVLASIVPFLFVSREKAFVFCSVICLLIMCMTYQAASGIYLLILLVLCFMEWNGKRKTNRDITLFLERAVVSFGAAMLIFKLFLMKPYSTYVSTEILPLPQLFSGISTNFLTYINFINSDFGFIWKALIGIICCFFIAKSIGNSARNKIISLFAAIILLFLLFFFSYGAYLALERPYFVPHAMYAFGVLLAIMGIYVASGYNKPAKIFALALSWSFLVFALSYGNALADQKRYVDFRATILLQDLSALFPDKDKEDNKISIQMKNTVEFTAEVRNIAEHNPVIYRLVPRKLRGDIMFSYIYILEHFNYAPLSATNYPWNMKNGEPYVDFNTLDLPVVLKTCYHTIKSDGKRVLVELNEMGNAGKNTE